MPPIPWRTCDSFEEADAVTMCFHNRPTVFHLDVHLVHNTHTNVNTHPTKNKVFAPTQTATSFTNDVFSPKACPIKQRFYKHNRRFSRRNKWFPQQQVVRAHARHTDSTSGDHVAPSALEILYCFCHEGSSQPQHVHLFAPSGHTESAP